MKRFLPLVSLVPHAVVAAAQGNLEVIPLRQRRLWVRVEELRP